MQNPRLFGTNGVRGVYGKDLNANLAIDLSYALATYYGSGPIVVGNDARKSSVVLSKLVRATLNSAGLDVGNAGLLPTPCLQYAAKKLGYKGGIMITASHNPPEYNGIKPAASDGVEISRQDELRVEDIYYSKKFSVTDGAGREFLDQNVINSYMQQVISLVDSDRIKSRSLTVAIDAGNGAQAVVAPLLVKALGCKVLVVNGNLDGDFPGRGSEPTPDNLSVLSELVRTGKADFGVAFDGDGDRSIFCDNAGAVYWGDKTGALIARHAMEKHGKSEIVCPINSSMVLDMVVKQAGGKVVHTRVGSVEVSRTMVERSSLLGLEENGGFMYGKLNQVRDGAMTTALVLDMLASTTKSFSELVLDLPKTYQHKSKFACGSKEIVDKVVSACIHHGSPKSIDTLDGAKIWIDEETWLMVRPSGTEPLIRMYAESTEKDLLDSKVSEYGRIIKSCLVS